MRIEENVPLKNVTTFRVGGPARFFIMATTREELIEAVSFARERSLPFFILGGGSNVLADDEGYSGVIIRIALSGIRCEGDMLTAAAGEPWDGVAAYAVAQGLWGIENLSGIPGTAGAAPVQNIGAYGASLADTLASLEALDLFSMRTRTFAPHECSFSYRDSLFKREPGRFIILSITLALSRTPRPRLSYADLRDRFQNAPALFEIRDAVLMIRGAKFPDLAREGTAGSFFLNPVVPKETAERLAARYPALPRFPEKDGVKVPIAWILDNVLSLRGAREGGVRAFERQPLVIVNDGTASARDIKAFARDIAERVRSETGIELVPEVCVLCDCAATRALA